jgi:hypothetical protein
LIFSEARTEIYEKLVSFYSFKPNVSQEMQKNAKRKLLVSTSNRLYFYSLNQHLYFTSGCKILTSTLSTSRQKINFAKLPGIRIFANKSSISIKKYSNRVKRSRVKGFLLVFMCLGWKNAIFMPNLQIAHNRKYLI